MIPVPNPYGSNGLIETAVKKNIIGVRRRKTNPDLIRFFLFVFDILNAMTFAAPKTSRIMNNNNASTTLQHLSILNGHHSVVYSENFDNISLS